MTYSAVSTNEKPQTPFLIFDIETVPDLPLLNLKYAERFNFDFPFDEDKHWNDSSYLDYFKEKTKIEFPPTIFHCVLSICAIYVNPINFQIIDGFKKTIPAVKSYTELRSLEKKILSEFWEFTVKYKHISSDWNESLIHSRNMTDFQRNKLKAYPLTFCGYNISKFDLCVLEQRSLINFLKCPIDEYAKNMGPDSYRYKYAGDKVFDLLNFITNYDNKNANVDLNTLAMAMGIGGKMTGMDGSKVAKHYFQDHLSQKIEEYCAIDVLITYAVFLVVQKFRGIIEDEHFKKCLIWFEEWLLKEGKPSSYKSLAHESKIFFNYAKERTS